MEYPIKKYYLMKGGNLNIDIPSDLNYVTLKFDIQEDIDVDIDKQKDIDDGLKPLLERKYKSQVENVIQLLKKSRKNFYHYHKSRTTYHGDNSVIPDKYKDADEIRDKLLAMQYISMATFFDDVISNLTDISRQYGAQRLCGSMIIKMFNKIESIRNEDNGIDFKEEMNKLKKYIEEQYDNLPNAIGKKGFDKRKYWNAASEFKVKFLNYFFGEIDNKKLFTGLIVFSVKKTNIEPAIFSFQTDGDKIIIRYLSESIAANKAKWRTIRARDTKENIKRWSKTINSKITLLFNPTLTTNSGFFKTLGIYILRAIARLTMGIYYIIKFVYSGFIFLGEIILNILIVAGAPVAALAGIGFDILLLLWISFSNIFNTIMGSDSDENRQMNISNWFDETLKQLNSSGDLKEQGQTTIDAFKSAFINLNPKTSVEQLEKACKERGLIYSDLINGTLGTITFWNFVLDCRLINTYIDGPSEGNEGILTLINEILNGNISNINNNNNLNIHILYKWLYIMNNLNNDHFDINSLLDDIYDKANKEKEQSESIDERKVKTYLEKSTDPASAINIPAEKLKTLKLKYIPLEVTYFGRKKSIAFPSDLDIDEAKKQEIKENEKIPETSPNGQNGTYRIGCLL